LLRREIIALDLHALVNSTADFPLMRAGLHTGSVLEVQGDCFGNTVNLAARVAAHAR
jgi:class 3 adenylate cyclase